jgi:hypothetical protein
MRKSERKATELIKEMCMQNTCTAATTTTTTQATSRHAAVAAATTQATTVLRVRLSV